MLNTATSEMVEDHSFEQMIKVGDKVLAFFGIAHRTLRDLSSVTIECLVSQPQAGKHDTAWHTYPHGICACSLLHMQGCLELCAY